MLVPKQSPTKEGYIRVDQREESWDIYAIYPGLHDGSPVLSVHPRVDKSVVQRFVDLLQREYSISKVEWI